MKRSRMLAIIPAMLLCFATASYADEYINMDGLTEAQQKGILADIAKQTADNAASKVVDASVSLIQDPEKLSRYAQLGADIAKGLGAAAEELGVAANELLNTPVGMLVAVGLIYNYMGDEIVTMVVGYFLILPLLFFGLRKTLWWIRVDKFSYVAKTGWFKGFHRQVMLKETYDMDAIIWAYGIWAVATLLVAVFCLPG